MWTRNKNMFLCQVITNPFNFIGRMESSLSLVQFVEHGRSLFCLWWFPNMTDKSMIQMIHILCKKMSKILLNDDVFLISKVQFLTGICSIKDWLKKILYNVIGMIMFLFDSANTVCYLAWDPCMIFLYYFWEFSWILVYSFTLLNNDLIPDADACV